MIDGCGVAAREVATSEEAIPKRADIQRDEPQVMSHGIAVVQPDVDRNRLPGKIRPRVVRDQLDHPAGVRVRRDAKHKQCE